MVGAGGVRTEVALKVLRKGLDPSSQAIRRLRDEARLLGLLNHPNIPGIHGLVFIDDRVTLVTEYVDGADLNVCARLACGMPASASLEVVAQVADALTAAFSTKGPDGQALELLHRDIKPTNIRISRHGIVKLLDFGIAKAAGFEREAETSTNSVIGSYPYMAPERFDDPGEDSSSDVYSLGCVLYEAITGTRLFTGLNVRQRFAMVVSRERLDAFVKTRLTEAPAMPPALEHLLLELLSYDPTRRPLLEEVCPRCEQLAIDLKGATLRQWCRSFDWPEIQPTPGEIVGRVITESALSQSGVAIGDATEDGPPILDLEGSSSGSHSRSRVGLAVVGGAMATGFAGVSAAVIALLLVFVVIVMYMPVNRQTAGVESYPEPAPALAADLSDGEDVVPPVEPRDAPGNPSTDPSPVDAALESDVPDGSNLPDCHDTISLEPKATIGRLTSEDRDCLAVAIRDESARQVDRARLGRLLLVDARYRCDNGDSCAAYETEQRYFFEEISRSDADMLYAFATFLNASEAGDDGRRQEALLWANRSLERKSEWRGVDRVNRVDRLMEIRSEVSYARFSASPRDEKLRTEAKNYAIDWLNNRIALGMDYSEAMELCTSAAGVEANCRAFIDDVKLEVMVTFVSIPAGASVTVGDEMVGDAPIVVALGHGAHKVQMHGVDGESSVEIEVGDKGATRWLWRARDDKWESSF